MKKKITKNMKQFMRGSSFRLKTSIILFLCVLSVNSKAQNCIWGSQSPAGTINVSSNSQTMVGTFINPGTYSVENFTLAGQYALRASFGSYFTLTDNSNNPIASGPNTLTVTIPSAGLYRVHLSSNSGCGTGGGTRIVAIAPTNRALNFDGANDYVSVPSNSSFNFGTNDFTIETWEKTTVSIGNQVMIGRIGGGNNYWLGVGNGTATFSMIGGVNTVGTTNIADGNWHHIAAVRQSGVVSLYVDGVFEASQNNTGTATISGNLTIGNFNGGYYFPGSLDEVRLWNRALCRGEIINNKNGEISTTSSGLVANYHFNQGVASGTNTSITTLTDDSGNSNTGTLINFALTGSTSNWIAPGAFADGVYVTPYVAPTVSISGASSICNGSSITYTASGNVSTYNWLSGPTTATNNVSPVSNTTYSVVGTNSLGCLSNTATITLTVNSLPSLTVSANNPTICSGSSSTLTANATGAGTILYSWVAGPASSLSVVSPTSTTVYTVNATDANSCVQSSTVSITTNVCSAGEAINFDGSDDYIPFNNPVSGDFTIEYWVKTTQTGGGPNWFGGVGIVDAEYPGTTNDFGTALVGSKFAFGIGNPDVTIVSVTNINDGNWHHVAGTWVMNTGAMSLYVDGVLESTGSGSTNSRNVPTRITIGSMQTLFTYFNGEVDEVRIWNIARTQCEINTYKNCEIPSTAVDLLANYHFNQGYANLTNTTETTLIDASGNVYNGTLNNFALTGTTSNWIAPGGVVSGNTTPANATPTVTVNSGAICAGQSFTMIPSGASTYTYSNGTDVVTPTANASYTVTGTNANGCKNTAVSTVTVNLLPVLTVVTNNTLLCVGQTATLSVSGAITYTWSTTENTSSVAVSPTVQTTYSVTGADVNGCKNNTTITQNVSTCTSITSLSNDAVMNVYPNPNSGLFTIELTSTAKVEVMNAVGQIVLVHTLESGKHNIDLHNEVKGVYFVKILVNNSQQTIKVIKE